MAAPSTLDPESFERLLSNAFTVQEIGVDAESFAAIVELRRAIATDEADVDGAMDMIAARARGVANATGIAIGLLSGDELVYRAGSGSGVRYVGQHVAATLCVSTHNAASDEILRVENAQSDRRIEATICRQFGAASLLILPIYQDGTMAGVLDVLFHEAHAFQPREVLSYRLMAVLVGEVMSYAARPEREKALAADLSTMQQSVRATEPQIEESLNDHASVPILATTDRAKDQPRGTFIPRVGKLLALAQSAWAPPNRANVLRYTGRLASAVGVAAVLIVACWIGFRERRPASPPGLSVPEGSSALEQQTHSAPPNQVLAKKNSRTKSALDPDSGQRTSRTGAQPMLDGNVRVRYISDDVTVRYFTPKLQPRRVPARNIRIRHLAEDVTVRYFTPQPEGSPSSRPTGTAGQPVRR